MRKTNIGGQAIMEGVMMKGKEIYAIAVRNPEGEVIVEKDTWSSMGKLKICKLPIIRGVIAFLDSMITGYKILTRSAEIAGEGWEDEEPSKFEKYIMDKLGDKVNDVIIYISLFISLSISFCAFYMLPLFLGSFFNKFVPTWSLGVIESLIRYTIFFFYIYLMSKLKDVQRIFQYHGAEHKTIACYEKGLDLTIDNVRPCSRLHKRCGTSFLVFVMVISMVVFFFVRTDDWIMRLLARVILVPFIGGISYEVIRWAGKSESKLVDIISYPGMCMQKITTSEPDDKQIETAILAMKAVLEEEEKEEVKQEEKQIQ